MTKHNWRDSSFTAGGTSMCAESISLSESAGLIDVTCTTTTAGAKEYLDDVVETRMDVTLIYNDASNPWASPPNLRAGQTVTVVYAVISGKEISGSLKIETVNFVSQKGDAIKYSVSGLFTGTVTWPSS